MKKTKKSKPCPCPIHKGKKIPLTKDSRGRFVYWHKGGEPEGTQGYCKQWRNQSENERNKAVRRKLKKAGNKKKRMKESSIPKQNNQSEIIKNPDRTITCTKCKNARLLYYKDFQSNGRGGIRQPCKFCIAKNRAGKKKLIVKQISLDSEM